MTKTSITLASLATSCLMALQFATATPVFAQGLDKGNAAEAVAACKAEFEGIAPDGSLNQGGCISYVRTAGGPVGFCKQLKDFGVLPLFGFSSQGDCVSFLTQYIRDNS